MISLASTTSTNVNFGASSTASDAKTYIVTISARFAGQTAWVTSASATYTYVNPCTTATITAASFPSISTSVLVHASSSAALWYDSVSGSASQQLCGAFTITKTFPTAPPDFDSATMGADFTYSTSATQATFTVSPTKQPEEVGSYVVNFSVCLTNYPTRCTSFDTNVQITACVITALQVVESLGLGNLSP